ncbi:MAG: phosphoglycerate dehydrogenase [Treponema sp.]|jgi:D-3-phosphoglycerate dehydrogenase|nr:phosphoglycerate dehydrogenase [Treponema sp.]
MFKIQTLNKISSKGLDLFPHDLYEVASNITEPDAILVRSADLHTINIPDSVKAIARAGAGYNNIPISSCTGRGIVVFNTPGANANAVKELTLTALFLASRDIFGGIKWVESLAEKGTEVGDLVEKNKSQFEGPELQGKTLGVIGLGAIGVMVANDACALGMNVIGYDPYISVDAAWNLSRHIVRADTLESLLTKSDYVTLHLPLIDTTKNFLDAEKFCFMKKKARLINFARGALVNEADLIAALNNRTLSLYVTDFPSADLITCPYALCIPHLGASTPEAEENCAVMAVQQLREFLETGAIKNSVNYPQCRLEKSAPFRLLVANKDVPNMLGQITTILAKASINITSLVNHSRNDYAYNIIDTEQHIATQVLEQIKAVHGIIKVWVIESTSSKINDLQLG